MEPWREKLAAGDPNAAWELFISRYRRLMLAVIRRILQDDTDLDEIFADICGDLSADNLAKLERQASTGSARFSTWLVTVVHNRTIDWLRHRDGRRRVVAPSGLTPVQEEIFQTVVRERHSHAEAYEILTQRGVIDLSYRDFMKQVTGTYQVLQSSAGRRMGAYFPGPPEELVTRDLDPDAAIILSEKSEKVKALLDLLSPEDRLAMQLFVIEELPAATVAKIVGWPGAKSVYNHVSRALARLKKTLEETGAAEEL